MSNVALARLQFATTIGFHFIFAPLSIGLAVLIVWLAFMYWRTRDVAYQRMSRFWTGILALTFAVGAATGLTMEFQFGTNWGRYSRYVGDIFGAPLAIEVIFAFFLESTLLYVLLFGYNRLKPLLYLAVSAGVAGGSILSAFWIIVANSWMQTPAGYVLRNGRAELANFLQAVFTASLPPRFMHTTTGAFLTGALFMAGVSAWLLLRRQHLRLAQYCLALALIFGLVTAGGQLVFGHWHAIQVERTQPAKMAAFEGVFDTADHVGLLLFGMPDMARQRIKYELRLPSGLSLMLGLHPSYRVHGLRDFPREDWPPVPLSFYPFHLMIALGFYFIAFTALGVFLLWRGALYQSRWYLWLAVLTTPLPFVANELGWMAAELGRQPWIVYHLMRTREAVSVTVPASHIWASMSTLGLVYLFLFIVWVVFVGREVHKGPEWDDVEGSERP
jgi:cytochrome bd ubiquinol oxidase subunit I